MSTAKLQSSWFSVNCSISRYIEHLMSFGINIYARIIVSQSRRSIVFNEGAGEIGLYVNIGN